MENNVSCTQAMKTTHGLDVQHKYVDRTLRGRVSQKYYYYYYKICIAHKFKHARVGGAGVAGWENRLAGEGK